MPNGGRYFPRIWKKTTKTQVVSWLNDHGLLDVVVPVKEVPAQLLHPDTCAPDALLPGEDLELKDGMMLVGLRTGWSGPLPERVEKVEEEVSSATLPS